MILHLGIIVEGFGDVAAVPVLVRRLCGEGFPSLDLRIRKPYRATRYGLVRPGQLENVLQVVAGKLPPPRAILVLLDADDDCPAELGPDLAKRAAAARPDVPAGVVLAKREFEGWFLAAIESLAGYRGWPAGLGRIDDPESIRDAKKVLRNCRGGPYSPAVDQPALAQRFDIQQARRADSFDKCCREVQRLLQRVAG